MPAVTCGYVEREEQRDIQCGEVAGPGGYCERHGAMVAAFDRIAKALGDDATLHVERRPGGAWNAEVNYMGETIGDGGPTLAEAVANVLADLAVQRRRDPEKQLREALRDVLTHVVDLPEAQVCPESEARARALDRKIAAERAILVARKLIGERR